MVGSRSAGDPAGRPRACSLQRWHDLLWPQTLAAAQRAGTGWRCARPIGDWNGRAEADYAGLPPGARLPPAGAPALPAAVRTPPLLAKDPELESGRPCRSWRARCGPPCSSGQRICCRRISPTGMPGCGLPPGCDRQPRTAQPQASGRNLGELNTMAIRHPLSGALPGLGWLLDMPAQALDGDQYMPRVQGPRFGASERMVVSPGHEELGYFHMPAARAAIRCRPFMALAIPTGPRASQRRSCRAPRCTGSPCGLLTDAVKRGATEDAEEARRMTNRLPAPDSSGLFASTQCNQVRTLR
jgi:hypothetical protein